MSSQEVPISVKSLRKIEKFISGGPFHAVSEPAGRITRIDGQFISGEGPVVSQRANEQRLPKRVLTRMQEFQREQQDRAKERTKGFRSFTS